MAEARREAASPPRLCTPAPAAKPEKLFCLDKFCASWHDGLISHHARPVTYPTAPL